MPARPRWLLAIPDAIRQLEALDRELLTRRDIERLFGVSKVRAAQLMATFGAGRTGHILTLPRAELLRQLRRHRKRAAFRGEEARRQRVVTEIRKARLTGIRVVVPVEALEARLSGLPAGVSVEPGRIEVRFSGAKDAVGRLFALAQALTNDYEQFEALVEGGRPGRRRGRGAGMNEDVVRVELTDALRPARAASTELLVLPQLIVDAGPAAVEKFLEFFAARIANRRTRAAYGRAVGQFLAWCAARGLVLEAVSPLHVAAYIRTHPGSAPTVKQHLAAIRMLGDWLVVSQVIPVNPAAAVRGPKHVVTKGATPVLSPAEARRLLEAIDTAALAGRRDRALVSVMLYSFARVSAVIGMRRQDYFRQESRGWLRLHEKGGKRHDVPAHHRAAEALGDYLELAGPGAVAASRPGHDQAAGGGRGSAALDLLPHVSGDGDHGVSVERGDARTRAADRRARLPEDDEALRPDRGHDHRRRDRAHRDLTGPGKRRQRHPGFVASTRAYSTNGSGRAALT